MADTQLTSGGVARRDARRREVRAEEAFARTRGSGLRLGGTRSLGALVGATGDSRQSTVHDSRSERADSFGSRGGNRKLG